MIGPELQVRGPGSRGWPRGRVAWVLLESIE